MKYGPKSANPVAFDVSNLLSKDSVWSFLIKGSSKLKGQSVTEVTFTVLSSIKGQSVTGGN